MKTFVCRVLPGAPRLTPHGCAALQGSTERAASMGRASDAPERLRLMERGKACVGCEVGHAHARGEEPACWPDGTAIERRETEVHVGTNGHAKLITANGKTQSYSAWARDLGVSMQSIGQRLKRGWTEIEAVTTPRDEVPERLRERRMQEPRASRIPPKAAPKVAPPPPAESAAPRIESKPGVQGGKPVIAGTRIPVETILECHRAGWGLIRILAEHPGLTQADVEAAIASESLARKRPAIRPPAPAEPARDTTPAPPAPHVPSVTEPSAELARVLSLLGYRAEVVATTAGGILVHLERAS